MEAGSYQTMLASLRQTFMTRLPQGLTDSADVRLQRTLHHYIKEILRVQGTMNEQDILRETYSSMSQWFRRNTEHLVPEMVITKSTPVTSHLVQQKDFLQKQEDVVKYRETEYNLVINSKDRDWVNGKNQNRYNFSVQLGGTRPQGTQLQTTITNMFRNITRIEFIKTVIPVEGLDVIRLQTFEPSGSPVVPSETYPSQAFYSALALPYVQVMMDEIIGNNYGTNDTIDRSLAICQYDAAWRSEVISDGTFTNRGYTLFFPKFMKAQRVYAPAPLASLQKMSFQILTPENQLLSKTPDSAQVKTILDGTSLTGLSNYIDATGDYLFIETTAWFSLWAFSQIDKVQLAGIEINVSSNTLLQPAAYQMTAFLQREEGHVVVGIAHQRIATTDVDDGPNECGYANYIVIRNQFADPTTNGTCTRKYFDTQTNETALQVFLATQTIGGAVLNLSRQVQFVMRIITRDLDPTSNLRPDNI